LFAVADLYPDTRLNVGFVLLDSTFGFKSIGLPKVLFDIDEDFTLIYFGKTFCSGHRPCRITSIVG
jgi:hypothetical protein